jgi:hypothetical protein
MYKFLASALFGTVIGSVSVDNTTIWQTVISGVVSIVLAWITSRSKVRPMSDEELEHELKSRDRSEWENGK